MTWIPFVPCSFCRSFSTCTVHSALLSDGLQFVGNVSICCVELGAS